MQNVNIAVKKLCRIVKEIGSNMRSEEEIRNELNYLLSVKEIYNEICKELSEENKEMFIEHTRFTYNTLLSNISFLEWVLNETNIK